MRDGYSLPERVGFSNGVPNRQSQSSPVLSSGLLDINSILLNIEIRYGGSVSPSLSVTPLTLTDDSIKISLHSRRRINDDLLINIPKPAQLKFTVYDQIEPLRFDVDGIIRVTFTMRSNPSFSLYFKVTEFDYKRRRGMRDKIDVMAHGSLKDIIDKDIIINQNLPETISSSMRVGTVAVGNISDASFSNFNQEFEYQIIGGIPTIPQRNVNNINRTPTNVSQLMRLLYEQLLITNITGIINESGAFFDPKVGKVDMRVGTDTNITIHQDEYKTYGNIGSSDYNTVPSTRDVVFINREEQVNNDLETVTIPIDIYLSQTGYNVQRASVSGANLPNFFRDRTSNFLSNVIPTQPQITSILENGHYAVGVNVGTNRSLYSIDPRLSLTYSARGVIGVNTNVSIDDITLPTLFVIYNRLFNGDRDIHDLRYGSSTPSDTMIFFNSIGSSNDDFTSFWEEVDSTFYNAILNDIQIRQSGISQIRITRMTLNITFRRFINSVFLRNINLDENLDSLSYVSNGTQTRELTENGGNNGLTRYTNYNSFQNNLDENLVLAERLFEIQTTTDIKDIELNHIDPRLENGDIITVDNPFGEDVQMLIDKIQYDIKGGDKPYQRMKLSGRQTNSPRYFTDYGQMNLDGDDLALADRMRTPRDVCVHGMGLVSVQLESTLARVYSLIDGNVLHSFEVNDNIRPRTIECDDNYIYIIGRRASGGNTGISSTRMHVFTNDGNFDRVSVPDGIAFSGVNDIQALNGIVYGAINPSRLVMTDSQISSTTMLDTNIITITQNSNELDDLGSNRITILLHIDANGKFYFASRRNSFNSLVGFNVSIVVYNSYNDVVNGNEDGIMLHNGQGTGTNQTGGEVFDIETDSLGNIYILDRLNDRILVYTPTYEYLRTIGFSDITLNNEFSISAFEIEAINIVNDVLYLSIDPTNSTVGFVRRIRNLI